MTNSRGLARRGNSPYFGNIPCRLRLEVSRSCGLL